MKFCNFIGIAAVTSTLAACSMSLSAEQQAELDREYRPQVNAFLPACIATASGRKADYSAIRALGYVERKAMVGQGDYLYPAGKNVLMSKEGIRFTPGEGCRAGHDGVMGVYMGAFEDIGNVWVRALQAAGYQNTGSSPSSYDFTANGVKMSFSGQRSSEGAISFSITRAK